MKDLRETLVDKMVNMYGFEAEETIQFTELAEELPKTDIHDYMLEILVDAHKHFKKNIDK